MNFKSVINQILVYGLRGGPCRFNHENSAVMSARQQSNLEFDWSSITTSRQIQYCPCYQVFDCARLLVPLDWQDAKRSPLIAIAIIKLAAVVAGNATNFGGTLITNPGGPGASGVEDLVLSGTSIQNTVDGWNHYEILSFDPRGVGHSTPTLDCFGDNFSRISLALQQRGTGGLDNGNEGLKRRFAQAQAYGRLCASHMLEDMANGSKVSSFMSTASVARDMLEIVDRVEEERSTDSSSKNAQRKFPNTRLALEQGKPRIQYLGFSYGSHLGNTFAAMYPGRVGRMILDGIVQSEDYMKGVC